MSATQTEEFLQQNVTYALELNGQFIIVENVPARVSIQTGERLFSPETVEHLQRLIWNRVSPSRVVETPVYEFSQTVAQ